MRLANFTGLKLGRHLHRRSGGACWLEIPAAQTKTRIPIALPFPEPLMPALEEYLARWRPQLARPALWLTEQASAPAMPIADHPPHTGGVRAVNPHGFRDALATTVSVRIRTIVWTLARSWIRLCTECIWTMTRKADHPGMSTGRTWTIASQAWTVARICLDCSEYTNIVNLIPLIALLAKVQIDFLPCGTYGEPHQQGGNRDAAGT